MTTPSYAISTGHAATTEAARLVLESGGNAVDAGIAAFVASWISEPCMTGAGGGGFAMTYRPGASPEIFDFFCQTPARASQPPALDFFPVTVDFGDTQEIFHVGLGSTAVPGAIAGVFALHEAHGSIPLPELVQPARRLAREGLAVVAFQALDFKLLESILKLYPRGRELFFKDHKLIQTGDRFALPQLDDFLDHLSREGQRAFYHGEPAAHIAAAHQQNGGFLRRDDFENYRVRRVTPLAFPFRKYTIATNPAPAYGGEHIRHFLQHLESARPQGAFSSEHIRSLYEMYAKADTSPEIGNPRGNTTHISIVDRNGGAIALTASNGEGSGYFVPDTDIQLNNMLGEAALLPKGFHSWQPNRRLPSMMAPTMVLERGKLQLVTGSAGAGRIPGAIAQLIFNAIYFQLDPAQIVNGPRAHRQEGKFHLEPGFTRGDEEIQHSEWQEWTTPSLFFGGAHTVFPTRPLGTRAVADARRDGSALG